MTCQYALTCVYTWISLDITYFLCIKENANLEYLKQLKINQNKLSLMKELFYWIQIFTDEYFLLLHLKFDQGFSEFKFQMLPFLKGR